MGRNLEEELQNPKGSSITTQQPIPEYYTDDSLKKSSKLKVGTTVGGVVATTILGVSLLSNTVTSPTIEQAKLQVATDLVTYDIDIYNPDSVALTLQISNSYYQEVISCDSNHLIGYFTSLEPETFYTISVRGSVGYGDKAFFTEQFKTKANGEESTIEPLFVLRELGNYTYKLDILDLDVYYSDYQCYLTDYAYTKKELEISDHTIQVNETPGIYTLDVIVTTKLPSDLKQGITTKTIYTSEITIKESE
jgi:hypothetical protein